MKICLIVVACLLLSQCSTSLKDPKGRPLKPIVIPQGFTPPQATQLTFSGETGEAYYSPDGKKLIYQSKERPEHKNSQMYILDLNTKREQRITFNDGEDTCGYFSPDGKKIIYSSTTDELKENPPSPTKETKKDPKKYEWKFQNYEVYQANPDGSGIKRLTNSKGYDAEATFSHTGRSIIFTSIRDGDLELYTMRHDGRNQRRLTNIKGYDGGGFFSPDSKNIVWRGFHDRKGSGQIIVSDSNGKGVKKLTTKEAIHWAPFWHPSGKKIIFSSNRDDKHNFELYQINTDGTCLKRLTYSPAAEVLPVFSPDGSKVVFTSNRSGNQNQVFEMEYKEPADCLPETP